jgi:hypothetical protein
LVLLGAGEAAIAGTSGKVFALDAVATIVGCDFGYVNHEDFRERNEARKRVPCVEIRHLIVGSNEPPSV